MNENIIMKKLNLKYVSLMFALLMLINLPSMALMNWPSGPAPCNVINDLESCINGVADGEIIEVRGNILPSQSSIVVSPAKSFTLRAADGFNPVFPSFTSLYFFGSDDDITVVIEGLTFEIGNFSARQGGQGTLDVTFRNNVVEDSTFRNAIEVSTGNTSPPYGPVIFLVEDNIINIEDEVVSGISIGSFLGTGNLGVIANNRITASNTGQAAAISVYGSSNSSFFVDVIGNEISGQNFNSGISLRLNGTGGFLTARAINNVISGQSNVAGRPAGIALSNNSSGFGHANFEVINNTLAFNERGISYGGRDDLGATSNAIFLNNVIAFNSLTGISLSDFEATTNNDFNLVFGNASNNYTPGSNDIEQDPLFVGGTNLRLQSLSPALNKGLNSALPDYIVTDIDGEMRIHQEVVDVGAYESSVATDVIFKHGFE
jgi:hypothetical protein